MQELNKLEQQSNKRVILKKHVATIHCTNHFSLLQRKISNALLFHAYHELLAKDEHQVNIQKLCNIIGYVGNNSAAIKDAVKGLMSTVLEWNIINEKTGQEEWNASTALASVRITGSLCIYSYSKLLKKLIYTPSVYGQINMIVQSKFKSAYGLALYENCIRYSGLPTTAWFDISIFRKLMGVPDNQYLIFRDFKRRVLDKAVEEVNTHSELFVEPELNRVGKKVEKIRFILKIRQNNQPAMKIFSLPVASSLSSEESAINNQLINELVDHWKINNKQAQTWLNDYGANQLQEKMAYVKSTAAFKNGMINQVGGYLRKALENNYQFELKKSTQKIQPPLISRQQQLEYERYKQNQIIFNFKKLALTEQNKIENALMNKLRAEAGGQIFIDCYKNKGIESIKDVFADFVTQYNTDLTKEMKSLEEFISDYLK